MVAGGSVVSAAFILVAAWWYFYPSENNSVGTSLSLLADLVPMMLAVIGIIMSYKTPTKEHHNRTTIILFCAGLVGTAIVSLNRIRNDAAHKSEMDGLNGKLQSVGTQNAQILNSFVNRNPSKPAASGPSENVRTSESTRRKNILMALRNEYVISHENVSAGIIAGTEQPPNDWVNTRLKQLGEKWTVSEPEAPSVDGPPAPVYGNLADRANGLANDLDWFVAHRETAYKTYDIYKAHTPQSEMEFMRSNDAEYHSMLAERVIAIHKEFADLHFQDLRLDEILEEDGDFQREKKERPSSPFTLQLPEFSEMAMRFRWLAAKLK